MLDETGHSLEDDRSYQDFLEKKAIRKWGETKKYFFNSLADAQNPEDKRTFVWLTLGKETVLKILEEEGLGLQSAQELLDGANGRLKSGSDKGDALTVDKILTKKDRVPKPDCVFVELMPNKDSGKTLSAIMRVDKLIFPKATNVTPLK